MYIADKKSTFRHGGIIETFLGNQTLFFLISIRNTLYSDPYPISLPMEPLETKDAFGNVLSSGDSVQLTKELSVKGTKVTLKK